MILLELAGALTHMNNEYIVSFLKSFLLALDANTQRDGNVRDENTALTLFLLYLMYLLQMKQLMPCCLFQKVKVGIALFSSSVSSHWELTSDYKYSIVEELDKMTCMMSGDPDIHNAIK